MMKNAAPVPSGQDGMTRQQLLELESAPKTRWQVLLDNEWASGDFDKVLEIFKTYNFGISDENTENTLRSIIDDYKQFGIITDARSTEEILDQVWDRVLAE